LKETLSALKDYQVILNRISFLEKQLALVPPEIKKLENIWQGFVKQIDQLNKDLEATQEKKHKYEVTLAEEKIKHEKFEGDLSEVTNDKEYNAVLREIDNAKKEIARNELGISECLESSKASQEKIDELQSLETEAHKHYQREIKAHRRGQSSASKELKALLKERDVAKDKVPKGMLSKFNRIAERRDGVGLAFCQDTICKSCNVRVRHHIVEQLKARDKVFQCESCRRILFYLETEDKKEG